MIKAFQDAEPYSIAVVDFLMPEWDGLRTARELWTIDPDLWVIFASGASVANMDALAARAMRQDRTFVLHRPFMAQELRQLVQICTATPDPLASARPTGKAGGAGPEPLPDVQLEALLERLLAGQPDSRHALLDIRIDRLRQYADAEGQSAAAARARWVDGYLMEHLNGEPHRRFRVAFDEFVIVLLACSEPAACATAERLVAGVQSATARQADESAGISLSVGVVPIVPGHGDSSEVRLAAEVARITAYERGGNTVHVSALGDTAVVRALTGARAIPHLEYALEHDRFELWAQPIVPLGGVPDARPSLEILLRMRDRDDTLRGPGEFLPVAEQHGLASRIDRFVLCRTLESLAQPAVRSQVDYMSVNVSAYTLSNREGLAWLEDTLRAAGPIVGQLCIEITETAALRRTAAVRDFVTRMVSLGTRFALDDFGAGFSTFDYLQTLPVQYIKIDGGLVRGCTGNHRRLELLRRISDIGHLWDKRTVAEQVEDPETLATVSSIGIDFAQGYVIARPAPLAAALENGSTWMRLPVAANTALATAAPTGATPGSPTPVGGAVEGTMCTSTRGISLRRSTR
jgi:EAL domain-containing protein (putative c-di-GMP-specific phosphodiesterase class I)/GGDEF domain-containing protein